MVQTAFSTAARVLHDRKLSVIPIAAGKKYPGQWTGRIWAPMKWQAYIERLPTQAEIEEWSTWPDAGIGVALGKVSGIIAFDFDNDIGGLHAEIQKIIPASPCKKIGKKGFTAFYRYEGIENKKFKKDGEAVMEILSTGNQTVLPPSIHPDTNQPYYWVDGKSLIDFELEDLPIITREMVEAILALFEVPEPAYVPHTMPMNFTDGPADINEVAEALDFIDPTCAYEDWIFIGMALKDEFGDSAFSLWDSWSRKSAKYPKKGEPKTQSKWNSFKRSDGRGIGTVFMWAQEKGWKRKPAYEDVPMVDIKLTDPRETKKTAPPSSEFGWYGDKKIKANDQFPKELVNAPGLVGQIASWITSTAHRPQPILNLAAAVGFAGMVYTHRVQSDTGLRTNMLCLGIAPSGAGKNHPQECTTILGDECGLDDHLGGRSVTSGTALLGRIFRSKGRCIFIMDEFGRHFATMAGKNAASFQSEIITLIMELYSSAKTKFRGKEFADTDDEKRARMDIDQPCLNVVGFSVPDNFYAALTSKAALDGFLSRWLVFETQVRRPAPQVGRKVAMATPPMALVSKIRSINEWKTNAEDGGNLADIHIKPRILPPNPQAETILENFQAYCDERGDLEYERKSGFDTLWTRGYENAIKLALCAHDGDFIDEEAAMWACNVIDFIIRKNIAYLKTNLSDNETQAEVNKIINILREYNGWMPMRELSRKTQWLQKKRRDDILDILVRETQQILLKEVDIGNNRKRYEFKYNEDQ